MQVRVRAARNWIRIVVQVPARPRRRGVRDVGQCGICGIQRELGGGIYALVESVLLVATCEALIVARRCARDLVDDLAFGLYARCSRDSCRSTGTARNLASTPERSPYQFESSRP